jgi:Protein of unknown function (DUF4239)
VIVRLLILWGVIASASALAVLIHRRRNEDDEPPDYRVVLGFVSSAYGLLLGLLVVFAVGHYSDARHTAEDEATSLVALYDAVAVYPHETRETVRHDLICYMRSIVADDWPSMERGTTTEAPRTLAFGDRVRSDIRALPLTNQRESSAYGRAVGFITDASEARQQLLFFTEPEIPTPLWVVIYVGVFLLVFLIALHYTDDPRGRVTALAGLSVLLTVVVGVLAVLDRPFGVGARVQPNEMRHAIALLSVDTKKAILRPCPAMPQR